jgi:predicted  nucleic acid-binding Zn-ribbon protein
VGSLEKELTGHRKQWEKTMRNLEEQRVQVAELSGRDKALTREVAEKERRVAELEALLGEVSEWVELHIPPSFVQKFCMCP